MTNSSLCFLFFSHHQLSITKAILLALTDIRGSSYKYSWGTFYILLTFGTNINVSYWKRKEALTFLILIFWTQPLLVNIIVMAAVVRQDLPSAGLKCSFLQLLKALVAKGSQLSLSPVIVLIWTTLPSPRSFLFPYDSL